MELQEQLKKLFPNFEYKQETTEKKLNIWVQDQPLMCHFEKRKGKPITLINGYQGTDEDFKKLTKELKTKLNVGGSFKNNSIVVQGNYRDKIMKILKQKGFKVKRVGG
ncbi:MAG: translation initiation factor [Tenacibaculum sp.]